MNKLLLGAAIVGGVIGVGGLAAACYVLREFGDGMGDAFGYPSRRRGRR